MEKANFGIIEISWKVFLSVGLLIAGFFFIMTIVIMSFFIPEFKSKFHGGFA